MFSQEPATLFTTAKTWKQSKCPLGGKWINYVYPDNGIPLALKRNEIMATRAS